MLRFVFFFLCATPIALWGQSPAPNRLAIAEMQLALDNDGFSPGLIDGRPGRKTEQAAAFRKLLAEPPPAGSQGKESWVEWKIPPGFLADLQEVPESWVARSKLKNLGYESALEKIAEQFHVSEDFLKALNPAVKNWDRLQEGAELKVPALALRKLPRADYLEIHLSEKLILARDHADRIAASFPCSIAAKKEKRPLGWLAVSVLAPNPEYLFDPALFTEVPESLKITSKLFIPPGPNNPVGVMWIGLSATASGKALKGIGIHGTPKPEDIGKTESHGCFRMTNWDVQRLAAMLRIGTPVLVKE